MKMSARTVLICVMAMETYACGLRLPRQFVAQGFNGQNEESSKLEDMMDLSKPALHTLLKGLAALLIQLYPDLTPKPPSSSKERKEEPIKIFRQIMQIPGPMFPLPPVPPMYPCHQMCRQDHMNHQQAPQMPQDPLQVPQDFQQMSPQSQQIQQPQASRSQQYSNQIPDQCFPSSPCSQPNIDPQQNQFFPDQSNTC